MDKSLTSTVRQFTFEFEFRGDWAPSSSSWNSPVFTDEETGNEWSIELSRKFIGKTVDNYKPLIAMLYASLCLHSSRTATPKKVNCVCEIRRQGVLEIQAKFSSVLSSHSQSSMCPTKEVHWMSYSRRVVRNVYVLVETEELLSAPTELDGDRAEDKKTKFIEDMLRLLQNRDNLSDVLVITEDENIPANKVILATRSPVLRQMLRQNAHEHSQGNIVVTGFASCIVREFLQFLYTGKRPPFTCEKALEFLKISEKYEVSDLKEECENYLSANICESNALEILLVADQLPSSELRKRAVECAAKNIRVCKKQELFSDLPKSLLSDILWTVTDT